MPIMPYAMEKGPYLSVLEDFLNAKTKRAVHALEALRRGDSLTDLGVLDAQMPGSPYDATSLKRHVARDWWGFEEVLDNAGETVGWHPQTPFDPVTNANTGFWKHWYGQPEKVFRETMQRALEVALGVTHHEGASPQPVVATRHWHISIFWNCPHPWYEGWVGWKKRGKKRKDGQVTVVINTPAHLPPPEEGEGHHDGELFNSPLRPPGAPAEAILPYEVDPKVATGDNGLWVVSQVFHDEWTPPPSTGNAPSPAESWRPPTLGRPVQSLGPVVTVAIAEIDGGVLPGGRPYQKP